ncbi:hypothetical protein J6590_034703 [Homalodisca vitripennis]|nr:hypothetical protein J6590_034703 [Homalodisca vitripennis]
MNNTGLLIADTLCVKVAAPPPHSHHALYINVVYFPPNNNTAWSMGLRPQAPMMYACKFGDERLNLRL